MPTFGRVLLQRKSNSEAILKTVKALTSKEVLVGIPKGTPPRAQPEDEKSEPVTNALIGYLMETGNPEKNIPARPFLVPGVASAKDAIVAAMKVGAQKAFNGDKQAVERSQNITGLKAQTAVKAKITSNIPPPLKPRTIDAREARGVTRTNTLVDTGALLNSITYVIRGKGEE